MTPRRLGNEQAGVLRALVEHKHWYGEGFGCGWTWGSTGKTKRILDTLVTRGMVRAADEPVLHNQRMALVYQATEAGQAYVAADQAARRATRGGTDHA